MSSSSSSAAAPQKRGRACEACSKIKIRCSLGQKSDDAAPPCDRCVRLNKECILTAPKRQKDRVAELEAQVAQLTRLLHTQHLQLPSDTPPSTAPSDHHYHQQQQQQQHHREESVSCSHRATSSTPAPATVTASKKRRLDLDLNTPASSVTPPTPHTPPEAHDLAARDVQKLDQILSYELQQRTLTRYVTEIAPLFPMVPAPADCTLPSLRANRCVLLQAFLYAASPGFLSFETQEDIARLLFDSLSTRAMAHGEQSLELIQAIQIACLWYRAPKHHRRAAVYQLIDLASALASDLSTGGPLAPPSKGASLDAGTYESIEGWRAWLGCHVLSASMSIFMRKPGTAAWTEQHEQARLILQYSPVNEASDRWLSQYIKAERLCEEVAEQMELATTSLCRDISEPATRNKVQSCRNKILNWKMGVPPTLRSPLILFWEHVAIAYMHESVLHTPTNKGSFSAPYLAERLTLTDFPAPVITQDHITAVYELTAAVQAALDIFTSLDTSILVASPGLVWAGRAAYALYILAKLYIAVTAPGNTLGTIMDSSILLLPEYAEKMMNSDARAKKVDELCGAARIMNCGSAVKDWYTNYAQLLASNAGTVQSIQTLNINTTVTTTVNAPMPGNADLLNNIPIDWENLYMYGDSSADYGFDQLFTEPIPVGFEQSAFNTGMLPTSYDAK